nr:DUF4625 domain-containing protein [Saprospiraceae bacterium]
MKSIFKMLIFSSVFIFLFSCNGDEVDTTPPVIEFLNTSPQPAEKLVCGEWDPQTLSGLGGGTLQMEVRITDDIALSQLKIDIHPNFDCHGHRSYSTDDWLLLDLIDLEGTEIHKIIGLEVPQMVTAGLYHLQLRAVDESGNTSPVTDFWNLSIRNPADTILPEFSVLHPTEQQLNYSRGEAMEFDLMITDNRPFNFGGNARIELAYRGVNSSNTLIANEVFLSGETTSKEVSILFNIPQTLVKGDYTFFLNVWDGVNNLAEGKSFSVKIQ